MILYIIVCIIIAIIYSSIALYKACKGLIKFDGINMKYLKEIISNNIIPILLLGWSLFGICKQIF